MCADFSKTLIPNGPVSNYILQRLPLHKKECQFQTDAAFYDVLFFLTPAVSNAWLWDSEVIDFLENYIGLDYWKSRMIQQTGRTVANLLTTIWLMDIAQYSPNDWTLSE